MKGKLFTISVVSDLLKIEKHVLRFWEQNFPLLSPKRIGGHHRYYTFEDIGMIKGLHILLKEQGYTIKGVQKLLQKRGKNFVQSVGDGSYEFLSSRTGQTRSSHMALFVHHLHTIRSLRKEIKTLI